MRSSAAQWRHKSIAESGTGRCAPSYNCWMAEVSPDFRSELERSFRAAADAVIAAESWPETQRRMGGGTYPLIVAMGRIAEGRSEEEIRSELKIRQMMGTLVAAGMAEFHPGE